MNNNKRLSTIAIDLGTTNCVCSYVTETGDVELIPNKEGSIVTPSFIHVKQKGMKVSTIIGTQAKMLMKEDPTNVLSSYKTYMGTKHTVKKIPILGNMTALHCSYLMLKYLKESAEEFLETNINSAVITVPAYFDESQKSATKLAAKMAGLTVDRIVNEPTAATFYYGLESKSEEPKTILAYDLGGGTFDVSIIQVFEDNCVVIGTAGDNKLGGDDIDKAVSEYVADKLNIKLNKKSADYREKFIRAVEDAKVEFCKASSLRNKKDAILEIKIPTGEGEEEQVFTITRKEFESVIDTILDRTMLSVDKAMEMANIDVSDLDEVILVGGSTKVPYVSEKLSVHLNSEKFSTEYFRQYRLDPDLAVGLGAGMFLKYLLEDKLSNLTDIVVKSVGIEDSDGQMITLLRVGRNLPCTKTKTFVNSYDNQDCFNVIIYEGESSVASRNTKLGQITIPIKPTYKGGAQVLVKSTMSADGTLKVQAVAGDSIKDIEIKREYEEDIETEPKSEEDNKSTGIKGF